MVICFSVRTLFSLKGALLTMILLTTLTLLVMTNLLFKDRGKSIIRGSTSNLLTKPHEFRSREHFKSISAEGSLRRLKVQHEKKFTSEHGEQLQGSKLTSGHLLGEKALGKKSSELLRKYNQRLSGAVAGMTSMTSSPKQCNNILCTNYLSETDLNDFFSCQRSSTKRYRRFLEHRHSSNDSQGWNGVKPTSVGGILATGNCSFRNGEGNGNDVQ